ncbi:hypothetical protein ACH5RR_028650 [Cinchona calisaya]|uniref:LOB domain-containing protein n=1 Tax=Cinchona calisaya TaxID=153742 RepID=A0ABD2YPE5_9GENT
MVDAGYHGHVPKPPEVDWAIWIGSCGCREAVAVPEKARVMLVKSVNEWVLREKKKCVADKCPLAPYFPAEKKREFQAVQRIFGVSKVVKILKNLNTEEERKTAADSMIWEASCWQEDPIQGPHGVFRRVSEQLNFYKNIVISPQAPTTSQGTQMLYRPLLINGATNHTNNNGGITMMNNMNGVGDHPIGNSMMDYSSNSYAYAAYNNHVVQNMDHQNGSSSRAVILGQQHLNINNNQELQRTDDYQNGSAVPVILPQQHHANLGFTQPYYLGSGQYNSSTDAMMARLEEVHLDKETHNC